MIYDIYIPKKYTLKDNRLINVNLESIKNEIRRLSEGFTILHGIGYWEGITEPVRIFRIVTDKNLELLGLVETLRYLRVSLNQIAMFYTRDNEGVLITD